MRFRLTSLFFIIALAAVSLWGASQAAYARKLTAKASVYIPPVTRNEIALVSLSPNDAVLASGDDTSARVSLIKTYGTLSSVLHSATIQQNKASLWIQTPLVYSRDRKEFGFCIAGKSYLTTSNVSSIKLSMNPLTRLRKNQPLMLMEVTDSQNPRMSTIYSLQVEAIDKVTR